jgi:hypothetical protein
MRFAVALLALCSCNEVWGLDKTIAVGNVDARYFDAPADAPFTCPPIGQTPQFSRLFHQIPERCTEYSSSATTGRALTMCFDPKMQIGEGPLDGPFTPIAGLETLNQQHFDAPRLVPEGDQLIIRDWNESTVVGRIGLYSAQPLAFIHEIRLPNNMTTDSFVRFGTPTRGSKRRMFFRQLSTPLSEIEVDDSGTSTVVGTYTEADLGVTAFAGLLPSMTPDGLRIVYYGSSSESGIFYSDRGSISARFRPGTLLMGVPGSSDVYMTETCERIYFSAIGSLLWIQQL